MKTFTTLSVAVVMTLAATAYAQRGMHGGRNYNPATETTITGTVDAVEHVAAPGRGSGGLHLVLSVDAKPIKVHVGPAWFVESKSFSFAKGDALTVTGSKVTLSGEEVVIAREITKDGQVLVLRDSKGFPKWARHGQTR